MRLPLIMILTLLALVIVAAWRATRYLSRHHRRSPWRKVATIAIWVIALLPVIAPLLPLRSVTAASLRVISWVLYGYLSLVLPLIIWAIGDFIGRRSRKVCLGIGAVIFAAMWWGALFNRYNIDVREVDVTIKDLPAQFDGMTIVQLSDMHTGSYGTDTSFVHRVVEQVNALRPDLILFTGDIVNSSSDELKPFVRVLSRLSAPMGVYSVMGNHDYGDYHIWPDSSAKLSDVAALRSMQRSMGWTILDNSTAMLRRGRDSIALIGVENVGDPPFHTYGDLDVAYPTLDDPIVKILMSHNPAHWADDIQDSPDKNIALTLSGHTHAMQMSMLGLSPAALRYKQWGGLYSDNDRHQLYVNIGVGTVGMPARIGAAPEITLITLHKDSNAR